MTLGAPLALGLLALALPLALAFFVLGRPRTRAVSSAVVLRVLQARRQMARRTSRLRHWVALLLVALAAAVLCAGLVDPRWSSVPPRTWVVVLDRSASMRIVEDGQLQSRLQRGADRLEALLADFDDSDRVALVAAGPRAEVVRGLSSDVPGLLDAARALTPMGSSSGDADALAIAASVCRDGAAGAVVWITDGPAVRAEESACPVFVVPVGEPADNVGITAFSARPPDALGQTRVWLEAENSSAAAREVVVDVYVDEHLIDAVSLDLDPGAKRGHALDLEVREGSVLRAMVQAGPQDAMADDDRADAVFEVAAPLRTLLVTAALNGYVAEALAVHPRVDRVVIGPSDALPAGRFDWVVLEADVPVVPEADHLLAFGLPAERFGRVSGALREAPAINRWSFDDPRFRYVDLEGVHLATSRTAVAAPGDAVLIEAEQGALALGGDWEGRQLTWFGFRPEDTDLVLRVAFVNLMANLVEWAGATSAVAPPVLPVGAVLVPQQPGWTRASDGDPQRRPAAEPVAVPGLYTLFDATGAQRGRAAVALLSSEETLVAPTAGVEGTTPDGLPLGRRHVLPWRLALILGASALLVEWVLPMVLGLRRRKEREASGDWVRPTRASRRVS